MFICLFYFLINDLGNEYINFYLLNYLILMFDELLRRGKFIVVFNCLLLSFLGYFIFCRILGWFKLILKMSL